MKIKLIIKINKYLIKLKKSNNNYQKMNQNK